MTREEILSKAKNRLKYLYGDKPHELITERFLSEVEALEPLGVLEYFSEISAIREGSLDYDDLLVAKAPASSSFLAYLLGATSENPLPPHYVCPKCKHLEWAGESDCVFDLDIRTCTCGGEMGEAVGYNIPLETSFFAKKVKNVAYKKSDDIYSSLLKEHFQMSLLGAAKTCQLLSQETGFNFDYISLCDLAVKKRVLGGYFCCFPPKLAEFLREAYKVVRPKNYKELLTLIGLAHGTGTWRENAKELLENGECTLENLPSTCDDVYEVVSRAMREIGVYTNGFASDFTNKVKCGYYAEHGMDESTSIMLNKLGLGEWFKSYVSKVRYLGRKALAVLELKYSIYLTSYEGLIPEDEVMECMEKSSIWDNVEILE